jgi:acyl-CoA thioesterase-1
MLLRLLLMISLWAPLAAGAAPTILVLGDSLSAAYGLDQSDGWVNLLQQRLEQAGYRQRVANASISGETTRGALSRLAAELERHDPSIVLIELGGNDGLRGLPLDEMRRNLADMIGLCRARKAQVVLAGMRLPPNYGEPYGAEFQRLYADVARRHGVALMPFFLDGVGGVARLNQFDGIHPTAEGYQVIADRLWPHLRPLLTRDR